MLLAVLAGITVLLTHAMFSTRQMMLGFPSAIFWAILGGYAYTTSEATWDIYYLLFFASMGMAIFCMFAMYALREKRDTLGDRSIERGDGEYIDEEKGDGGKTAKRGKRSANVTGKVGTEAEDEEPWMMESKRKPQPKTRKPKGGLGW